MEYHCTYLTPDQPEAIDMGDMSREEAQSFADHFDWQHELEKMSSLSEDNIYYSPSLKFEDLTNGRWIELSVVGEETDFVFYIFYKRPKMMKRFFGLTSAVDDNFVSDRQDIPLAAAGQILERFFDGAWEELEKVF